MVSNKENGFWGLEVAREDMGRTVHKFYSHTVSIRGDYSLD